ncbi:zinc finger, CCHC-type containing protein [Tanacetum coccineum]
MAAYSERMERFENAIFKQSEEINDRMTEMFGLLKELTTSKASEKVFIREETKFPVTKNVNFISLVRGEEKRNDKTDETLDNTEKPIVIETEIPVMEAKKSNETKNKPIKKAERKEVEEVLSSRPVEYYLKHRINEKLIDGLFDIIGSMTLCLRPELGRDVLVEVAEHVYPVDFMILDIKENEKRPFILGTPFLATAKAAIKFDKGTIPLRSGKSKISFHRIPDSPCITKKGVKNDIEPIAPTMTVNRLVLEWEEKIKLHLEREMKFNQWRSKSLRESIPLLLQPRKKWMMKDKSHKDV